jgi:hypothetical protein
MLNAGKRQKNFDLFLVQIIVVDVMQIFMLNLKKSIVVNDFRLSNQMKSFY